MLITQLHASCVWDGAAIVSPDHFILGERVTAIEVRRSEDKLDLHFHAQLFEGLPPHGLQKALPLLKSTGDTLPLPGPDVLCLRTLQQVLAISLTPKQYTNHWQKSAYSHQISSLFGTAPDLVGFPRVPSRWTPLLWGACQCTMKSRITMKARSGASAVTPCPHPGNRSKRTRCAGRAATKSS
jgi:hypothetical protein